MQLKKEVRKEIMNGSDVKYTSEYVEIQTSLEHIRTKLENIEHTLRDIHHAYISLAQKVERNRIDIAGVKAGAAVVGGLAGTLFALLSRLLSSWKAG